MQLFVLVFAPLLSLIISTLGTGLLTTLLTVRLGATGGGVLIIGLLTAVYYAGLVFGSFLIGRSIRRVGHIRVYATCAAVLAVSTLLHAIVTNNIAWLCFRFISGYCVAGLYVAVESWLLVISPEKRRGLVLSLYMISFYAALACGQFLLNASDPKTMIPFMLIGMLCSISIVPICMTSSTSPKIEDIEALSLVKLYKISPTGVIGCFTGGIITSVIFGLMPLFISQMKMPTSYVALTMSLAIFGAMCVQYPIGRLSDFIERRKVLTVSSFALLIFSLMLLLVHPGKSLFLLLIAIFGGFAFVIYPLSINHTCDYLEGKSIVAATQGLLFANGIGSIVGPIFVPAFIHYLGPFGLFVYFTVVAGLLGVFFALRRRKSSSTPVSEQREFVSVTASTPVSIADTQQNA